MITLWFRNRRNAWWVLRSAQSAAQSRDGTARRFDKYHLVRVPDCSEVRELLSEVGLEVGHGYPQDDPVELYRKINGWKEW